MKLSILAVTAVSAAAAVTTGVASYEAFAPGEAPAATAPAPRQPSGTVTRFADCPKGTVLRGRFCIRIQERTVTEYVTAPPSLVQQASAPSGPAQDTGPVGDGGSSGSRDRDGDRDDDDFADDHDDDGDDRDDDRDDHDDDHDDDRDDDDRDDDDHDDDDHDDDHDDDDHDDDDD